MKNPKLVKVNGKVYDLSDVDLMLSFVGGDWFLIGTDENNQQHIIGSTQWDKDFEIVWE